MSQEWSRVVSSEVMEEYMTLQGIHTYCSQLTSQNPKSVKSHLSLTIMRVKLVLFIFDLTVIQTRDAIVQKIPTNYTFFIAFLDADIKKC